MILENELIRLEVDLQAAEMHHLIYKPTQKEWIWQADPKYWPQRNPILFPIVGSTHDKIIHLNDQHYQMGNHGFTRHAKFTLDASTPTSLTLSLQDSLETRQQYPFRFKLSVTYGLELDRVLIHYKIENCDDQNMPFSFGLHPAFRTQHNGVDGPQVIEFPCLEDNLPKTILNEHARQQLHFTDAFFEKTPTLILHPVHSPYVTLIEDVNLMDVSTTGYRWLAFWKKPQAQFICIEPWHGHDDFEKIIGDFKNREGTLILEPGHIYTTSVSLRPHQGEHHV